MKGEKDLPFELRAIIFDLDGVLVDSEDLHTRAKVSTLAHFGLQSPPQLFDQFKGRTDAMFFQELLSQNPHWDIHWKTLVSYKTQEFIRLYPELKPIPGAKDFIQTALTRSLSLAVVTSATERSQEVAFDLLNLRESFSVVINASHVNNHKPHPEPYLLAKDKLGPELSNHSLVIEDSPSGIQAAKAAGLFVIGITTTFPSTLLKKAGADHITESYSNLKAKLFKI